ncbi:MAG: phytanoyl-CoA dioxygenase family protein [Alphaproteobacteria bacterium]|nr:phytanoyl-CoA dioxygenase family protein [Alphaproteobacteria bacterium]
MRYSLHTVDAKPEGRRLPAETLARFRDDGAILIRGALAPALTARFARELDLLIGELERRHGQVARPRERDPLRRAGARLIALAGAAPDAPALLADAMAQMPAMHAAAADMHLLGLLGQLLAPTLQVDRQMVMEIALPDEAVPATPPRPDHFLIHGGPASLTVLAPLQHTDWTNGAPRLALGAHRAGAEAERFASVIETVIEPGDALVCHGLLPRLVPANRSADVRFAIALRYRDVAAAPARPRIVPASRAA